METEHERLLNEGLELVDRIADLDRELDAVREEIRELTSRRGTVSRRLRASAGAARRAELVREADAIFDRLDALGRRERELSRRRQACSRRSMEILQRILAEDHR